MNNENEQYPNLSKKERDARILELESKICDLEEERQYYKKQNHKDETEARYARRRGYVGKYYKGTLALNRISREHCVLYIESIVDIAMGRVRCVVITKNGIAIWELDLLSPVLSMTLSQSALEEDLPKSWMIETDGFKEITRSKFLEQYNATENRILSMLDEEINAKNSKRFY